MITLEIICLAIIVAYVLGAFQRSKHRSELIFNFIVLTTASWIVEDSCIHFYHFYEYHSSWIPFFDRVPLLIILIWPVVILSSSELASYLLGNKQHPLFPLAVGALVVTDAAFIEPIAVHAGLWSWSKSGIFGVPLIGIFGWGMFAGIMVGLLRYRARQNLPSWMDITIIVIAPMLTHLLLVGSWWGVARWLTLPAVDWLAPLGAWLLSFYLSWRSWRRQLRRQIPRVVLLSRIPAAAFFFGLLLSQWNNVPLSLGLYALAFAPPYFSLMQFSSPTLLES